jgi:hypothetical protein
LATTRAHVATTVDNKNQNTTTTMTSSLQRAAAVAAAMNAMQNVSLETGLAGIDLSEVTSSSQAPSFPGTTPAHSASLRDRLDQDVHRRRVQDQQEVQLMAAMQASRTAARMNPSTNRNKSSSSSSLLGDVIVGMHAVEQGQESRMKLRKGKTTPSSHATRRQQQQQTRGTKSSPSKKVFPIKKKKNQKTKY